MWAKLGKLVLDKVQKSATKADGGGGGGGSGPNWFAICAAGILSQIIITVVIIAFILAPLSYTWMLVKNGWDILVNSWFKTQTNFTKTMDDWFGSEKNDRASKDDSNAYEEYLIKRFAHLSKKLKSESMEPNDVSNAQQVAVGWVYGKIFGAYFEVGLWDAIAGSFGLGDPDNQVPVLKSIDDSAANVYSPQRGEKHSVVKARKLSHNDDINAYDIQAFDFVAGTLFDVISLDLSKFRETVIEDNKEEIDNAANEDKLKLYQKAGKNILQIYGDYTKGQLFNTGASTSAYTVLETEAKDKLIANNGRIDVLYLMLEKVSISESNENLKWLKGKLADMGVDERTKKSDISDDAISKVISNDKDYDMLYEAWAQIPVATKEYMSSINTSEDKKASLMESFEKGNESFGLSSKVSSAGSETKKKVEGDVDKLVNKKMEEALRDKITELNLTRTDKAAKRYRDALTETEEVGSIHYTVLNREADLIKRIENIPNYSKLKYGWITGSIKDPEKEAENKLFSSKDGVNSIGFIRNKFILDKTYSAIISGVDVKTNQEYMPDALSSYIEELEKVIISARDDLERRVRILSGESPPSIAGGTTGDIKKVILDPGHGGYDAGAVGPTGLREKDVVLSVGLKMRDMLEARGVTVAMTRDTDIFIGLQERVAFANATGGDYFLSIHTNSNAGTPASGSEIYASSSTGKGAEVAKQILSKLVSANGLTNRGFKTANFAVIKPSNKVPSSLVELAFTNNPKEENLLRDDAFQTKMAQAMVDAITLHGGGTIDESTIGKTDEELKEQMKADLIEEFGLLALEKFLALEQNKIYQFAIEENPFAVKKMKYFNDEYKEVGKALKNNEFTSKTVIKSHFADSKAHQFKLDGSWKSEFNTSLKGLNQDYEQHELSDKDINEFNELLVPFYEAIQELAALTDGKQGIASMERIKQNLKKYKEEQLEYLNGLIKELQPLKEAKVTDTKFSEFFKPADISTVYINGDDSATSSDYRKDNPNVDGAKNSILVVTNYKNSVEEAVKIVANELYPEILEIIKLKEKGTFGPASVMDVGNVKIGALVNTPEFEKGIKSGYLEIIKEIAPKYGIDPYIMFGTMIQESNCELRAGYAEGNRYVGLFQIDKNSASDMGGKGTTAVMLDGTKKTITYTLSELLSNPRIAIEAGVAHFRETADELHGNIYASVVGYNRGPWGVRAAISWHLKDEVSAIGKETSSQKAKIDEYLKSGDTGWLEQLPRLYGSYGNAADMIHLEKVMGYYDTRQGAPYIVDRATGTTITVGSGGIAGGKEEGKSKYHNKSELALWKEYYTDKKIFEEADKFSSDISKTIISEIEKFTEKGDGYLNTTFKEKFSNVGLNPRELQNLIAGAVNLDTDFKIGNGSKDAAVKKISDVASNLLDSFNGLNGKGKLFGVYLYASGNSVDAKRMVNEATGSFKDFAAELMKNAESNTDIDPILKKVAQIVSGDKNIDVTNFYTLLGALEDDRNMETPPEAFYREWLEGKYTMHEIYNAVIDDEELRGKFEPLPIMNPDGTISGGSDDVDKDLMGYLVVKNENGAPTEQKVPLRRKLLDKAAEAKARNGKPEYIVIHDTGLTASGEDALKQYNKYNSSSDEGMHYVIDSRTVYNFVEPTKIINHLGEKQTSTVSKPKADNSNSIGVEFTVNASGNFETTFWNTVALTKYMMREYGIPSSNVVMHEEVTGHNCSAKMKKPSTKYSGTNWQRFKKAIEDPSVTIDYEAVSGNGQFKFYSQGDPRWASKDYGGNTIAASGCGPTSLAMALSGHNIDKTPFDTNKDGEVTPDEVAAWSVANNHRVPEKGSAKSLFISGAKAAGLQGKEVNTIEAIKDALRAGNSIIVSYSGANAFTNAGHLIALVGLSPDNLAIVHDPAKLSLDHPKNGPNSDANIMKTFNYAYAIGPNL